MPLVMEPTGKGPPPPGGDVNRAGQMYGFTWSLLAIATIFVLGRMYSRVKLTRNLWWDDWCICITLVFDFAISVMWHVYAGRGYARHIYYLKPDEISNALELNAISRSLCVLSIGLGKISVALLIERISPPGNWRKWMLRAISISIAVSASITFVFFYAQCQPVRALWDKRLIKLGTGSCWDPKPLTKWNLVIASYWTFLDFALAFIPIDIVWRLQMRKTTKLMLCFLLSMGVFAGVCAAVKTAKIPITVTARTDITWSAIELLMWNGIELNIIIIAACIPTLRPLCLLIFRLPAADAYRPSAGRNKGSSYNKQSSYHKTPNSSNARQSRFSLGGKAFGKQADGSENGSTKGIVSRDESAARKVVRVESREVVGGIEGGREGGREWGDRSGEGGMPLMEVGRQDEAR